MTLVLKGTLEDEVSFWINSVRSMDMGTFATLSYKSLKHGKRTDHIISFNNEESKEIKEMLRHKM